MKTNFHIENNSEDNSAVRKGTEIHGYGRYNARVHERGLAEPRFQFRSQCSELAEPFLQ